MANNPEITMLLDFYGEMLTEKQRNVIDYYYNDDLSLSEIAENEGITRQGIRDSIKRAENQMFDMEARLGLCKRFREMQEELEIIRKCAAEIEKVNSRIGVSDEITKNCKMISESVNKLFD